MCEAAFQTCPSLSTSYRPVAGAGCPLTRGGAAAWNAEKNQLCGEDLASPRRSVLGGVKGILCFQEKNPARD